MGTRRNKLIALGVLAAVILLVVGAYFAARCLVEQNVGTEIARIRARGEPVSPADLAGKPIPDDDNAALIYAKAFPLVSAPAASDDFDVIVDFLDSEERAKRPDLWNKAREITARYEGVVSIVREAAARPKCKFDVDWEAAWAQVPFDHLGRIHRFQRLLAAKAILSAKSGDTHHTVEFILLQLKLVDSCRDDCAAIPQFVRLGLAGAAARSVRDLVLLGSLNEDSIRRIAHRLDEMDLSDSVYRALIGERALGIQVFDQFVAGRVVYDDEETENPTAKPPTVARRVLLRWEERFFLRTMARYIEAADLPYREAEAKHVFIESDAEYPRMAALSKMLLCGLDLAWQARDRAAAELAMARAVIGLVLYKQKLGAYPDKLDALVERLDWTLPQDPFSGKPLKYRRKQDGFVIYSIGRNLRDDRGVPAPKSPRMPATSSPSPPSPEPVPPAEDAPDDIVWSSRD